MNDELYVRTLLAILTDEHPQGIDPNDPYGQASDGIDRYDGFGRDVWVESIRVVEGDHGSELEVGFGRGVPEDPALADVPSRGSVRVPFDPEWRQLSGHEDPAGYAPRVAMRVWLEAHQLVARARAGDDWEGDRQRVRENLPDRGQQWHLLLEELSAEGSVSEPSPGRITVRVIRDADSGTSDDVTVLVTPDEWEELLVDAAGDADNLFVWELFGPRLPDERYIVFYEGDLVRSTREKVPPVHGQRIAEMARRVAARSRRP